MSDNLELDRVTRKAKAPAKAWRNKYRYFADGHVGWGDFIWPSKEVAEVKAAEGARDPRYAIGRGECEYLGAFPAPT
jgi:hypothetical protein